MAVQDALESPGWVRDPGRGWAVSRLDSLTGIDDVRTSDSLRDCRSEAHEWLLLNLRTGEVRRGGGMIVFWDPKAENHVAFADTRELTDEMVDIVLTQLERAEDAR